MSIICFCVFKEGKFIFQFFKVPIFKIVKMEPLPFIFLIFFKFLRK